MSLSWGVRWLTHALPHGKLDGHRIFYHFGFRIEAHRRSAHEIILGPAAIAIGGESDPGGVHTLGELRRRISPRSGSVPNPNVSKTKGISTP